MIEVVRRKRLRLADFDYSTAGAYLVTVCAREHLCLFGHIETDTIHLSRLGRIVADSLDGMGRFHEGVYLDVMVVMPNHVHAILVLERAAQHRPPPVPAVVGAFKARASRRAGQRLWPRGYHDRIVRSDEELSAYRRYVMENPLRWALDRENPERVRRGPDEIRPLRTGNVARPGRARRDITGPEART